MIGIDDERQTEITTMKCLPGFGRIILLLCLFFSTLLMFGAQPQPWRFQHLTVADGLSQNNVFAILQDRQGFMWFGTPDGLNRYDGHRFTVFKSNKQDPKGLTDSTVNVLYEDRQGFIWIGTNGGGLNRFDPQTSSFSHFLPDPSDPTSITSNRILDICEDPQGVLWIATNFGLCARHPGREGFTRYMQTQLPGRGVSSEYVSYLAVDKMGILWVGTFWGLDRYDRAKDQFDHYHVGPMNLPFFVRHILPDDDGSLWLVGKGKLLHFDPRLGTFQPVPIPAQGLVFNKVFKDEWGRLVLTSLRGLYFYDPRNSSFDGQQEENGNVTGLSSSVINSYHWDRQGNLWLGTDRGVNLRLSDQTPFRHLRHHPSNSNSLSHNYVFAFGEDDKGILWIGTLNGLNAWDRKGGIFTRFFYADDPRQAGPDNVFRTLLVNEDGTLWLGTDNGLKHFDPRSGQILRYDSDFTTPYRSQGLINKGVRALRRHMKGFLWVGTTYGLALLDEAKQSFGHFLHDPLDPLSLGENTISCLYHSRNAQRTLWIGTTGGGLSQMLLGKEARGRTVAFNVFGKGAGLASVSILSIYEDKQGILWLGTPSGLDRFDPKTGTFENFSEATGLPNNYIYGILADNEGKLWLSSNRGLIRFDPVSKGFTRYGSSQGLQDDEFNRGAYFKNRDGMLFFGGVNGFNFFDPGQIRDSTVVPAMVITSVRILPRNLAPSGIISDGQRLNLQHDDALLVIDFAALSFVDAKANRYAYQIEGLHRDWIDLGHIPSLSLGNPGPGSYRLRIKGASADGVWNEAGISLQIVVTPPFYRTWWFMALLVIGLAGLAFFLGTSYRRFKIHRVKSATDLKEFCVKAGLSAREQEIVLLLLEGKSNKEIEDKLFVAESTVRNHISNIHRKLEVKNRAQLVAFFKNYKRE